ncbi:FxsA family protein [Paenibacillus sp. SC116]|uniref:FxsA family protein n=1 Tax=Paenibacillus sp. SC116 TaxID=2968986 RepID=UPI00215B6C2C|nr:FxsA family protein [Paenibacillus sp. SC116]
MHMWFLLLLVLIPAMEIWGFIFVSGQIGGWNTFLLVIVTAIIGVLITRHEAAQVWGDVQQQMQSGQIPGRKLVEGLCVMLGGILLLTPGFVTDIIGFTMVFPLTRPIYRHYMLKWIEKKMQNGNFHILR